METIVDLLTASGALTLWWVAVLCAVSFLGSFLAGALGLGGGMLVLATMAQVLPPTVLIPVHGVVQLGSNLGRAMLMARHILYPIVPAFLAGSLIGGAVGANVVVALPKPALLGILGAFVLYATWAPGFRSRKPGRRTFFVLGTASTFATMFVGGTGAMVGPFSGAASPNRQQVVATHATLMTLQHGLKIVAFGILGFAFGPYLPLLAGLLGFGFLGTWSGRKALLRLPERAFRWGLRAVLTLLGLKLLYDACSGFTA